MATLPLHLGGTASMVGSSELPGSAHLVSPMDTQSLELQATPRPGSRSADSTTAMGSPGHRGAHGGARAGGRGCRGAEGAVPAVDIRRRLVQRSRCGCSAGLPACSPVTAGEEVAPRLGDGEMTLRALFSEAVMMPGCPEPANAWGGEKLALGVAFLRSEASPGLCCLFCTWSEHISA